MIKKMDINELKIMQDYMMIEEGSIKLKNHPYDTPLEFPISRITLKRVIVADLNNPDIKIKKINTIISNSENIISSLSDTIAKWALSIIACMGVDFRELGYISVDISMNVLIIKKERNGKNFYNIKIDDITEKELNIDTIDISKVNQLLNIGNKLELEEGYENNGW